MDMKCGFCFIILRTNIILGRSDSLTSIVGLPDLVKPLRERPRVQEEEDRRGDGDQRDQLAQPETKK